MGYLNDIDNEEELTSWLGMVSRFLFEAGRGSLDVPVLSMNENLRRGLTEVVPLPDQGADFSRVLEDVMHLFTEGNCNVFHPLYFGYISPRPHPFVIFGDFIASALNQTPGAWRAGPSATLIEVQVLSWFRELFGLPRVDGNLPGGIFTGGGTIANTIALKAARDRMLGESVQYDGLNGARFKVYTSLEGHFSLDKAMDTLGLGVNNLVKISTDNYGAMNYDELKKRVYADVAAGYKPLAFVATLGTTATGAIDPLYDIGKLARDVGVWFHIDAASGLAFAALEEKRFHMKGLELSDSITFDPCKWMFASFGVGCLLVRDGRTLANSFNAGGHYWEEKEDLDLFKMNLYGTRQFRSLGIWCLLKGLGLQGYRELLENILYCVDSLRVMIQADSRYELLDQQGHMPILCFRVNASSDKLSDKYSQSLVNYCQYKNLSYPTVMEWNDRKYIRLAFSNYAIKIEDLDKFKNDLDEGLVHLVETFS